MNWTIISTSPPDRYIGEISATCSDGNVLAPISYGGYNDSGNSNCTAELGEENLMPNPTDNTFNYRYEAYHVAALYSLSCCQKIVSICSKYSGPEISRHDDHTLDKASSLMTVSLKAIFKQRHPFLNMCRKLSDALNQAICAIPFTRIGESNLKMY